VTSTVVIGGYRTLPECLMTITRRANSAKVLRSRTPAKLYSCETILQRLTQDLNDMAAKVGDLVEKEYTVVSQRHLARHRRMPPPIRPTAAMVRQGAKGAGG
jgi:hypothetical protein